MRLSDIEFTDSNSRTINKADIPGTLHIEELAESIRKTGLISPIVLVETETGGYEVLAGQRRYLALKSVRGSDGKLEESEYVIWGSGSESEEVDLLELSIVENQFRESLSPMDLNRAARKLNRKADLSDKEIAKILNITPHRLKRIIRLSQDLPKMTPEIVAELQKSGDDAPFTDAHWDKMRDIEDKQTIKDVFEHVMDKNLPPRELPSLIKSVQKANDEAYGYDDEGAAVQEQQAPDELINDGTTLKYKHKGLLTIDESDDGNIVFNIEGKNEDGTIPVDSYLEYLRHPEKFKCKIDLKLTFTPIQE